MKRLAERRRVDLTKTGWPVNHGTTGAYKNHGCRCEECTQVWSDYCREYTHRTGRRMPMERWRALNQPRHGGQERYVQGCRCEECTRAMRRRRTEGRLKAAGVEGTECPDCGGLFHGERGVSTHQRKGQCS